MTVGSVGEVAVQEATADAGSPYAQAGGAAGVRDMVVRFHRLVFPDSDMCAYFGAVGVTELRLHQSAQLTRVLGGPDWYQATGVSARYTPLEVPAMLFHRAAFYLVRAVDECGRPAGSREAVLAVAAALADGSCRIIGGLAVGGLGAAPSVVSVEGAW